MERVEIPRGWEQTSFEFFLSLYSCHLALNTTQVAGNVWQSKINKPTAFWLKYHQKKSTRAPESPGKIIETGIWEISLLMFVELPNSSMTVCAWIQPMQHTIDFEDRAG